MKYTKLSIEAQKTLIAILEQKGFEPFYAGDVEIYINKYMTCIEGGWMNALANRYLIEPTGNTRASFIEIDDDIFRKVEAKEWRINPIELSKFMASFQQELARESKFFELMVKLMP